MRDCGILQVNSVANTILLKFVVHESKYPSYVLIKSVRYDGLSASETYINQLVKVTVSVTCCVRDMRLEDF